MPRSRKLDPATVERSRKEHTDRVVEATQVSEAADEVAQEKREAMYATWFAAHGPAAEGRLSYQEIADAAQVTRGWVIGVIRKLRQG